MSTLTKEWLLKTIAELEEERDATPGAVNEDAARAMEAMKIALASLEADVVAWTDEQELRDVEKYGCGYLFTANPVTPNADPHRVIKLYTAPPAPVSDSLLSELLGIAKRAAYEADECAHAEFSDNSMEHSAAIADWERRAAMLQGVENAETPTTMQTAPALDSSPKIAESPTGNSPVIPDGWVACSERLPPEGYEPDGGAVCYLVWHKNEVDCGPQYSISNVFFLRKHWEKNFTHWMPLPAAPQQEVK